LPLSCGLEGVIWNLGSNTKICSRGAQLKHVNYKHNANGLPFTISNHKTISQQNNNFNIFGRQYFSISVQLVYRSCSMLQGRGNML